MNDQAKNWFCDYAEKIAEKIKIICISYFPRDPETAKDVTQDILLKLSKSDKLDEIDNKNAWVSAVTRNACMDHFRKLRQENKKLKRILKHDLEHSRSKFDKRRKIDPLRYLQLFVRDEFQKSEELDRSFFYVLEAFGQIRGMQRSLMDIERIGKVLAALRDIGGQSEKILSNIEYVHSSPWNERHNFQPLSAFIRQQIKELVRRTEAGLAVGRPNMLIDFGDPRFPIILDPHLIRYYSRWPRCFIGPVPNEFYVLWGIWNRILRKEGKYGNRKLLKKLLLGYKKLYAGYKYIDTFNSLTEETNFETMRVMSYRLNKLNKGYSELADFIFNITINPPSCTGYKKIGSVWYLEPDGRRTPTDEKKPGPPSSI
jgi:hypothetical protein